MRHAGTTIVFATMPFGLLGISLAMIFGQTGVGGCANIAFSPDEQIVSVVYQGRQWNFQRPVVSPWAYQAEANVYWVATSGDVNNPGTVNAPFRNINDAITQAGPGDIVYIQPGTYIENLLIEKSGADGEPIIISCAPGGLGTVKITPPAAYVAANPDGSVIRLANGAQYVWINGLVIEGPKGRPEAPTSEHFSADGVTWSGGAGNGCRATNNVIYNNVHCGLKELAHGGSNILMEGNVIFNNGSTGSNLDHGIYCPANNCTMDGNIIFNNAAWGMAIYSNPIGSQIYRNVCFGNGSGGISLSGTGGYIYNNVFAYSGIGIIYYSSSLNGVPCNNNVFENNICAFNNLDFDVDTEAGDATDSFDDYNDYISGGTPSGLGVTSGTHEISADPLFINAALGDFRLAEESPCIGSGTLVGLPNESALSNIGAF